MRVAVTGARGQLGSELVRAFVAADADVIGLARPIFVLESPWLPNGLDLVVNAAAWTDVDGCAQDPERAMVLNGVAAGRLARSALAAGARFVQVSTNEVFAGDYYTAYSEDDEPRPINPYGASKLAGERAVRGEHPDAVIVRTAWIFGGPRSFPTKIVTAATRLALAGEAIQVVADETGNPTPAAALAERIVRLAALRQPPRTLHLAGDPPTTRLAWARMVLAAAALPDPEPITLAAFERASNPPPHAVLDTTLARSLDLGIHWSGG